MDQAIVPFDPSVAETLSDQNQQSLPSSHEELHKKICKMVLEKNNELKKLSIREKSSKEAINAVPISCTCPEDDASVEIQKKARNPTECIGELLTSFDVPKELLPEGDINELAISKNNIPKFSFSERLADWKLERRERLSGHLETYYRHTKSGKTFKSSKAVVNFLLYEIYPENNTQKLKQITEQGEFSNTHVMDDAMEQSVQEITWIDETHTVDEREGVRISPSLHTHIVHAGEHELHEPRPCRTQGNKNPMAPMAIISSSNTPTPTVSLENIQSFILSTVTQMEPLNIIVEKHPETLRTVKDEWKMRMTAIPLAYVAKLLKDADERELIDEEFRGVKVALDVAESLGATVGWIRSEVEELRSNQVDRRFYERVKALRNENKELENKVKANEEKIRELQAERYHDFDEPIPKRRFLGGS